MATALYLRGPGLIPSIGNESGRPVKDGIAKFQGRQGTRYVLYVDDTAMAAIHVISRDGRNATISNAFTRATGRRRGYASRLLKRAREDFESVTHSANLTPEGRKWAEQTGGVGHQEDRWEASEDKPVGQHRLDPVIDRLADLWMKSDHPDGPELFPLQDAILERFPVKLERLALLWSRRPFTRGIGSSQQSASTYLVLRIRDFKALLNNEFAASDGHFPLDGSTLRDYNTHRSELSALRRDWCVPILELKRGEESR